MTESHLFVGVPLPIRFVAEPYLHNFGDISVVHSKSNAVYRRRLQLNLPEEWTVHKNLCALTLHDTSFAVLTQLTNSPSIETLSTICQEWQAHRAAVYALAEICVEEFTVDGSSSYSVVPNPTRAAEIRAKREAEIDRDHDGQVATCSACEELLNNPYIVFEILKNIDGLSLFAASKVCRLWNEIANCEEMQQTRKFPSPSIHIYHDENY